MKAETVEQIIGRVRKVMSDAVSGPLVVAADVVALSNSWATSGRNNLPCR